jgi:hypothetical protein
MLAARQAATRCNILEEVARRKVDSPAIEQVLVGEYLLAVGRFRGDYFTLLAPGRNRTRLLADAPA